MIPILMHGGLGPMCLAFSALMQERLFGRDAKSGELGEQVRAIFSQIYAYSWQKLFLR